MVRRKKKTEPDRFTPEIDLQIVDGVLGDSENMLATLTRAGFSKEEIHRRSRSLGLSNRFIAQCRAGDIVVSVRRCLNCDDKFLSMGVHLRLCVRCRRSA